MSSVPKSCQFELSSANCRECAGIQLFGFRPTRGFWVLPPFRRSDALYMETYGARQGGGLYEWSRHAPLLLQQSYGHKSHRICLASRSYKSGYNPRGHVRVFLLFYYVGKSWLFVFFPTSRSVNIQPLGIAWRSCLHRFEGSSSSVDLITDQWARKNCYLKNADTKSSIRNLLPTDFFSESRLASVGRVH